jgi:hypothetical protein
MFYVIGRPVYAPIYYPGTAILSAPSVWLGAAAWVTPLILSGIAIGLTYRIATELIDGSAGLLIALMVLATPEFRRISIMNLSQPPALVMGLLIILLWLRWRRSPSFWATLFIGLCIGGAVIVRPIDAICFAAPVGIAMLIRLRTRFDRILRCVAILLLGIAPFIALQLVFDRGVTGHWVQTPVQFLLDREMPGLTYGLGATTVPAQRPQTTLVQKQVFYQRTIVPFLEGDAQGSRFSKWYGQNGRKFVPLALPIALLVIFAPLVALSRRRLALIAIAPVGLFLVLYPMYPSFLPHYIFTFIPPIVMCVVLGMLALAEQFRQRAAIAWATLATVTLAMLLGYLPELDDTVRDSPPYMTFSNAEAIEAKLRTLPPGRSIVLFPFRADGDNPDEEPVHNCDAAWPDDQTLIRAHDLGERNVELFQYYAQRQPDREVYWFDRDRSSIRDLGNVKDLAAQ